MQGLWLEIIQHDKGIKTKVNHAVEQDNNTVENLQNIAASQQQECEQEVEEGNATDFNYDFFPRNSLKYFHDRPYLKHNYSNLPD